MQQQSKSQQSSKLAENNEKIRYQQRDNNSQFYSTNQSKYKQSNFQDKNLDLNIGSYSDSKHIIPCIQCTQPNQNCQLCLGKKERPISESMVKFMQYLKKSYKSEKQEINSVDLLTNHQMEQKSFANGNFSSQEKQISNIETYQKKIQEEKESEFIGVDNYKKMIWEKFQKNLIGNERIYLSHRQQNENGQAV